MGRVSLAGQGRGDDCETQSGVMGDDPVVSALRLLLFAKSIVRYCNLKWIFLYLYVIVFLNSSTL